MKKTFHIALAVFFGFLLSGVMFSGGPQNGLFVKFAFAQCTPGPCTGLTECQCNGPGGFGASGPPPFGCCSAPFPPPQVPGCTGGCPFVTGACDAIPPYHEDTRDFFDVEMTETERWMVEDWFAGYLLPSMMGMAEELTVVAMQQVVTIGSFFDATLELETQRLLQDIKAQAHKDYHPSEGVCVFATNVRGLAMTERKMDMTQSIMSSRSLNRHLGIENDAAAGGVKTDLGEDYYSRVTDTRYRSSRLRQFQDEYCNPIENNDKLRFLCGNGGAGANNEYRYNEDINFLDLFASQRTINMDFLKTEAERSIEEERGFYDYLALSKNLYGHKVPFRAPTSALNNMSGNFIDADSSKYPKYETLLKYRSMLAKRSVAENSFHAQTALKSQGEAESIYYLSVLLTELGMDPDVIAETLKAGPSYFAQMEILTKKIYQNPQFFVNLYDKPANVKRKHVALKAIGLMQNWDIWEANLRTEMLASVLLELALMEGQEEIQGR